MQRIERPGILEVGDILFFDNGAFRLVVNGAEGETIYANNYVLRANNEQDMKEYALAHLYLLDNSDFMEAWPNIALSENDKYAIELLEDDEEIPF
jgi:hypothetical protein